MLFLFTSPKSGSLYMRDLLNVCTMPESARVRFIYREPWLSQGAHDDRKDPEGVLVVFAEITARDENGKPSQYQYHPVRFGKIIKQDWHGDRLARLYDVELVDYFDYSEDKDSNDFATRFQSYVEAGKSDYPLKNKWVCQYQEDEKLLHRGKEWEPLVQHMRELEGLKNAVFIGVDSPPFPARLEHEVGYDKCDVVAGMEYKITLSVRYGHQADLTKRPTLSVSNGLGAAIGPVVRQSLSGVQMDYWVGIKRLLQSESGMLTVKMGDDASPVVSPQFTWMLRAKVDRRIIVFSLLLAVLGTVFSGVAPEQIKDVVSSSNALPVSLILKGIGALMLAAGAVLGFKFASAKEG